MSIEIRKFTESGIREFEILLNDMRETNQINEVKLENLVFNSSYTTFLENSNLLTIDASNSKYLIIKSIVESLRLKINRSLDKDKGLWIWLTALLLKKLVQIDSETNYAKFSKDSALYLYDPSWNRYYRHLLAFPCLIYSTLDDKGRIFLRGQVSERGEIVEQLAAVQDIQRNPGVIEAASILYYDSAKDEIVKGAASKPNERKKIGGQARRLREVLKQFVLTYDLNAMDGEQIVQILPKEFDRWKKVNV